jgi:hypothetical protein
VFLPQYALSVIFLNEHDLALDLLLAHALYIEDATSEFSVSVAYELAGCQNRRHSQIAQSW